MNNKQRQVQSHRWGAHQHEDPGMPQQGSGHAQQLPLARAQVPAALRKHSIQATLKMNTHALFILITSEAHPCKYLG